MVVGALALQRRRPIDTDYSLGRPKLVFASGQAVSRPLCAQREAIRRSLGFARHHVSFRALVDRQLRPASRDQTMAEPPRHLAKKRPAKPASRPKIAPPKIAPKAQAAVAGHDTAGTPAAAQVGALQAERDQLAAELKAAKARIAALEEARDQVLNRIDWVIDSLHSLTND